MVTRITIRTQPWTPTWPPVLPSPALMDFVTFSRSGQVAWGSQILGHAPGSFLPFLTCLESRSLPASSGEPARGITFLELATRKEGIPLDSSPFLEFLFIPFIPLHLRWAQYYVCVSFGVVGIPL